MLPYFVLIASLSFAYPLQQPRFKRTRAGTIVPQKAFWYLGVGKAIRELFGQAAWAKRRGEGRGTPGDFYTSEEASRLEAKLQSLGGSLHNADTSVYELGLDWGQVYLGRKYSVGVVGIR